jgi:drug/metabolite transporter (DMT)-like permease
MDLGAIQFCLMYVAYIASYQYLPGYLVAVFTIFTPLYVLFFNAHRCRMFSAIVLLPVVLSIIGTAIMVYKTIDSASFVTGFCILQVTNMAFAYGQVSYKHYCENHQESSHTINMVSMYLGAMLFTGLLAFPNMLHNTIEITNRQWMVLIYLGIIASGVGFYCWNFGAKQVNTVSLAIMNNGYVPFALLFSFTVFGEQANLLRLLLGSSFIALSLFLAQRLSRGVAIK